VPVRRRPLSMRDMTYAAQAEHTASQLLVFYHSIAQLASALEVPRAKARGWSAGTAPARPRVELLEAGIGTARRTGTAVRSPRSPHKHSGLGSGR
jgi:hypothetical protein